MKRYLLLCFAGLFTLGAAHAQTRQVSGRVTSATDGSLIAGVSVFVSGGGEATQTDANGIYSIHVPARGTLVFSNVGFAEQRVPVDGREIVNVVLQLDDALLDEVIVVAYGTVKKSDFTGSAVQIGAKELDKRPLTNVLGALQGVGPGVQTSAPSGAPGSSPTIRIRGVGSYSASNDALIVVDGVPFDGGMSNINPADIETVTVLKDAATIAMYGSRGANGVIMVTTKNGKPGQTNLDATVQRGFSQNAAPWYNTVSAGEYYELMWQAYTNNLHYGTSAVPLDTARRIGSGLLPRDSNGFQVYNGNTYQDIVQYLGNYNAFDVANDQLLSIDGRLNPAAKFRYSDFASWEDESSRDGRRNEYNLSYSTGIKNTDVYASLNYLDDQGWGLRSSADRFSGRVNANTRITDWLKTGLHLSGGTTKFDYAYTGTSAINNPFAFSRGIAPIYPVYVRDPATGELVYDFLGDKRYDYGNLVAEYGLSRPFNSGRHPIAETLMNMSRADRDFTSARTYVDVNIMPWLTFSTSFNADRQGNREEGYENTEVGDGAPAGRYNQNWYRRLSYTVNQLLRTNNTFGRHRLESVLGHEFYAYKNESISGRRTGEGFEGMYVFSNFADVSDLSSGLGETAVESYFARANYNYAGRYHLSAMVRRDGNSRFPAHLRWASFWSVGAAWRLDQERFFANDFTDLFKFRASYGKLGNAMLLDNSADPEYYPYQPGYSIGHNNASASGAALTSLGSSELTWESQKPLDIGVDFSFLNGRITGTVEYYSRNSDGLLFNVQQPYHNGGTPTESYVIAKNVGAMRNSGFEIAVTGNLIRREDFNWNLGANITTVKNKITRMPEETPEIISGSYKRMAGRSMYEYYTRTYYGVDPETGRALYLGLAENVTYDPANVNHKLIDQGNGTVDTVTFDHNAARLDYVGKSALPPVYGGIVNEFSYKNFDFGFVLTYSLGGYYNESGYSALMSSGPSNGANLHRDLFNAWQKPGDVTDVPLMDVGRTAQHGAMSTRWLQKASYLNISAINLSYRLPADLLSRAGIARARVFASAENLYFWSARKGFNPVGGNLTTVSANSAYTHARIVNFGVNFGF